MPGRSVAQPGSASAWGAEGREFESHRSDHFSRSRITEGEAMNAPKSDLEPWQWPEEHWRKLVARVRAGRPLHPASWPGGARCAVALSFDSDHETSDLRDGGKSIGRLAWGQFGNRVGVRTPSWDFSWNTLAIEQEMGLLYDSSLMSDEDCYELLLDGEPCGVIELPVEWVRDDAVYFMMNRFSSLRPYTPPTDVLDIFRREFEAAYGEGGLFQLTMHPHVIGYRSRSWIIEELIRLAQSRPGVWFATHADVARWAKENAG